MTSTRVNKKKLQAKSELEKRELAVFQSTNAKELENAFNSLFKKSGDINIDREIFKLISPLNLAVMVMRGYEIPDANARLQSNLVLQSIDKVMQKFNLTKKIEEQFWACLGYQREIILQHIETDLEALQTSFMNEECTIERRLILIDVHKLMRNRTNEIIKPFVVSNLEQAKIDFA